MSAHAHSPLHPAGLTHPQTLPLDRCAWGTRVEAPEPGTDEAFFPEMVTAGEGAGAWPAVDGADRGHGRPVAEAECCCGVGSLGPAEPREVGREVP